MLWPSAYSYSLPSLVRVSSVHTMETESIDDAEINYVESKTADEQYFNWF